MTAWSAYANFFLRDSKRVNPSVEAATLLFPPNQPVIEVTRLWLVRNTKLYNTVVSAGIVIW